jgi:hypothetical protein
VPEPARREEPKRHYERKCGRRDDGYITEYVTATSPREESERDECERIQFRGRTHAEGREGKRALAQQQADDRKEDQDGRPDVKAFEDEVGREGARQGRENEYTGGELRCVGAHEKQSDGKKHDRGRAQGEHDEPETVVVAVVGRRGRE